MANHKEIEAEDHRLSEAGFDPAAPAAEAAAKLGELRGTAGISDVAVARALGRIADPAAAAMLIAMETHADKGSALRREIRRSLFKLRQRGVEAPAGGAAPRASWADELDEPVLAALLSPIDSEGARIVWITKPRTQGGLTRLWGLVSEDEGLVGANVTGLSRRELRAEREELERRIAMKMVDADWRLADFVLSEAWRATPESRRARVGNFLSLRAELIAAPLPTELTHPVYAELGTEAAAEPSVELLKEPELLDWRLPEAVIKPYVDEIGQVEQSMIVVSPVQQQERVNTIVERAVGEILSGERAHRTRRRLEDVAWYMTRSARRQQAGWAASAAAKIRDGEDLKRVAFFQGFIRTQLGTMAAAEEQRARAEPRLIMTPAEAMRAREAQMRRRSP
ncbi:MAG TPA: hypothetical protein VIX59_08110 [Candidatus Binataceae bacterium]